MADINVSTAVHTTIKEYASVDIDWWHDCGGCSGGYWGDEDILHINLSSTRLLSLVSALSPVLVRIGGSRDNNVRYEFGNMSLAECKENTTFRGKPLSLCMNRTRWDEVLDFYTTTGARMVFGLSFFTDPVSGEWLSDNVEALLQYTAGRGVVPAAFELGEEMSPSPRGQ